MEDTNENDNPKDEKSRNNDDLETETSSSSRNTSEKKDPGSDNDKTSSSTKTKSLETETKDNSPSSIPTQTQTQTQTQNEAKKDYEDKNEGEDTNAIGNPNKEISSTSITNEKEDSFSKLQTEPSLPEAPKTSEISETLSSVPTESATPASATPASATSGTETKATSGGGKGGGIPGTNTFLKRFTNLSKTLNKNPAVIRAGIVLQSAKSSGVFPVGSSSGKSTKRNDDYYYDDEDDEDDSEEDFRSGEEDFSSSDYDEEEEHHESVKDSDEDYDPENHRRSHAEMADSTAEEVTTATVSAASAMASSTVSSGFRGRYAVASLPKMDHSKSLQSNPLTHAHAHANASPLHQNGGRTAMYLSRSHSSPIDHSHSLNQDRPNHKHHDGNALPNTPEVRSPASGLLSAISKRGNQIMANVKASPSSSSLTNLPPGTYSQTALIFNSSAGPHMQKVLSDLKDGEYVMFLGPGFMGVNLKQSSQRHFGVYIDYIVPNGAADKSGVVSVGDCLLKVGNVDVRHGTIRNVPQIIAQAPRPVIIVLRRSFHVIGGPMDVAIGKVLQVQEQARGGTTGGKLLSHLPVVDHSSSKSDATQTNTNADANTNTDTNTKQESTSIPTQNLSNQNKDLTDNQSKTLDSPQDNNTHETPTMKKNLPKENTHDVKKSSGVKTFSYHKQNSNLNKLPSPSREVKASLAAYANKRNNEMSSFAALSRAAIHDQEFREIIVCAFYACCLDPRCLTFVAAHFSGEDSYDYYSESNGIIHAGNEKKLLSPNHNNNHQTYNSSTNPPTSSIRLMFYLEILSFEELFGVTPTHRHRDHAKRIANKFLIPTVKPNKTHRPDESVSAPIFDLRSALPPSLVDLLARTISDESATISINLFQECKTHVQESLCGHRFANFLISNECARMRAYLRGTCHFRHFPVEDLWRGLILRDPNASNYFMYTLVHFVCWSDEFNDSSVHIPNTKGKAVAGICAALFIKRELMNCIEHGKNEKEKLIATYEYFWQVFLGPYGGMLDPIAHSNECQKALDHTRSVLVNAIAQPYLVKGLVSEEIIESLNKLAEELVYDYAVNMHSKFKVSVAHELACWELRDHQKESYDGIPKFPVGCIDRLIRKSHFPAHISTHKPRRVEGNPPETILNHESTKPLHEKSLNREHRVSRSLADQLEMEADDEETVETSDVPFQNTTTNEKDANVNANSTSENAKYVDESLLNADFAIVFGSDNGDINDSSPMMGGMQLDQIHIKRFATISLGELKEAKIPPTLESYAVVPCFREKSARFKTSSSRISHDGWEASLINYIIPNPSAENPNRCIYGVSLVLHQRDQLLESSPKAKFTSNSKASPIRKRNDPDSDSIDIEDDDVVVFSTSPLFKKSPVATVSPNIISRVSDNVQRMIHSSVTSDFSQTLLQNKWSQISRKGGNTIGISLISSRNVIPAMRSSLSQLFEAFTLYDESEEGIFGTSPGGSRITGRYFAPLADILGTMSMPSTIKDDLRQVLEPYIHAGTKPWMDRPLSSQKDHFQAAVGIELIQCLPPVPLALLFIATLLEQKIIFSSTRRSVLLSACTALTNLLAPLEWSHLLVPLVPSNLAQDLIQYPAPYIIGIPSDDALSIELLNSLPQEVTLVDLDVGRVILASSFASESNKVDSTMALRSQMLNLAESLGDLFGEKLSEETWLCDNPYPSRETTTPGQPSPSSYQRIQKECGDFILELLTGTSSCCFHVKEHFMEPDVENSDTSSLKDESSTILFDEDRFLSLKNLREQGHYMPLLPSKSISNISGLDRLGLSHHFALSLENFDLILKSFLRTQAMSTFISSRPQTFMAFW